MEVKEIRGFQVVQFTDRYDVACSLQISFLAGEPCVWLGCDNADLQELTDDGLKPVEGNFFATTRMHLSKSMVAELLPHLIAFTQTGLLDPDFNNDKNIVMYAKCNNEIVKLTPKYLDALVELMKAEAEMMNRHRGGGWDWGRCTITDLSDAAGVEFRYDSADYQPNDGLGQFGVVLSDPPDRPNEKYDLLMIDGEVEGDNLHKANLHKSNLTGAKLEYNETKEDKYVVYYAIDPAFMLDFIGISPELGSDIRDTHFLVANIHASSKDDAFDKMQSGNWDMKTQIAFFSFTNEQFPDLKHHSMSVGDILRDPQGQYWQYASTGWKQVYF